MKRRILSAALATTLILSLAGCDKKDVSSTSTFISETPIASTEVSVSTEASTETPEASTETEAETADVEALYKAFMAGEAKAMVTAEGDKGQYYTFTNAMTAGEYYTLDEIITNLSDNMEQDGWDKRPTLGEVTSEYIDCGKDGKKDLHVNIELPVEGIENFIIDMVIVEKDGKLKIAYDGDSWSRSGVSVDADGFITNGGSAGASVHVGEAGFVDGNGDFKFISKWEEDGDLWAGDFYVSFTPEAIVVDLSSLDVDDANLSLFTLKEQPKAEDIYVTLYKGYEGEEYDLDSPLAKAFKSAGINVVSKAEAEKIMSDRLSELGYK